MLVIEIKGGPMSGKSTAMEIIGKALQDKGIEVKGFEDEGGSFNLSHPITSFMPPALDVGISGVAKLLVHETKETDKLFDGENCPAQWRWSYFSYRQKIVRKIKAIIEIIKE